MLPVLGGKLHLREGAQALRVVPGPTQKALQVFHLLGIKGQDGKRRLRRERIGVSLGAEAFAQGFVGDKADLGKRLTQPLGSVDGGLKGAGGFKARCQAQAVKLPCGGKGVARQGNQRRKGIDQNQPPEFHSHRIFPLFALWCAGKGKI